MTALCRGLCTFRRYANNIHNGGYNKNNWCSICVKKIPKEDAFTIKNDRRPRCPCCHYLMRTGSFIHSTTLKTNVINLIMEEGESEEFDRIIAEEYM